MEYNLIRSKRKTIGIYIKNGTVEVRAPNNAKIADIDKFVSKHENWISDRLEKDIAVTEEKKAFTLNYGDKLLYRGAEFPICEKSGNKCGFDGECFYIPAELSPAEIKSACIKIYKKLAKRDLTRRTLEFARQMNLVPSAIKINGAEKHWGSCSAKHSINFSWKLIMADEAAIDYVIVHELAHIAELNHSEKFWAIVGGVFPDYLERKQLLIKLQERLNSESWD